MNTPKPLEEKEANTDQIGFELLNDLTESQLIRSKHSLREFNGLDIAQGVFLILLAIEVLRKKEPQATLMSVYANNALRFNNFDKFRTNSNDLYLLLHVLLGRDSEEARNHLKDAESSKRFLNKITADTLRIKNYLRYVQGKTPGTARTFFLDLESRLKIGESGLRSLRRRVVYWDDLERYEQEETALRLSALMRRHLLRSELRSMVNALVQNLDT